MTWMGLLASGMCFMFACTPLPPPPPSLPFFSCRVGRCRQAGRHEHVLFHMSIEIYRCRKVGSRSQMEGWMDGRIDGTAGWRISTWPFTPLIPSFLLPSSYFRPSLLSLRTELDRKQRKAENKVLWLSIRSHIAHCNIVGLSMDIVSWFVTGMMGGGVIMER